ncbi:short-chain dehydrogenase [Oceanicola sp. 22II-s10i]|uniref:SDR family NAD(P)-dependent oxidoreductase n=1 Tax=Oceanicola sp. 22II-s10i TaxID=1317116 RepID=UPI000B51F59D|nr:SDR family NAD(P)-dependent oxidoreductase [Oceanicola sp. 22II-s10i]OWU86299.1 short-chain dehydrogenase [Oceanicola sp. 22II-s10i]
MPARAPLKTLHYHDLVASLPDLAGRTVAITGCTSGMGLILAHTAAAKGARVLMINRPSDRADRALAEIRATGAEAHAVPCDLLSFDSVRAAGPVLDSLCGETGLDVLVDNAGLMGLADEATGDGFDVQMQANHLSHFLLVHLAWPHLETAAALRGEARVVNHSSGARNSPKRPLTRKYLEPNGGNLGGDGWPGMQKWVRYQQSKLANLLFTYALQDRAGAREGNAVKVLCAHPGPTDSGLQAKSAPGGTTILDRYILRRTLNEAHSVEDGTCGLARAAFEPGVAGGEFYGPDAKARTGPALRLPAERDEMAEAMLWQASLAATGISDFFH